MAKKVTDKKWTYEEAKKKAQADAEAVLIDYPELAYIKPAPYDEKEAREIFERCVTPRDDRFVENMRAAITKQLLEDDSRFKARIEEERIEKTTIKELSEE